MKSSHAHVFGLHAIVAGLLWSASALAQETAEPPKANGIAFREPQVQMNEPGTAVAAAGVKSGGDLEDLQEKRDTLESELRYARSKLEAAQRKLAVQSAAGNAEELERINVEIKDWEARIAATQQQLATVDAEIGSAGAAAGGAGLSDSDVIVPGENLELFVNEDPSFNNRYQVRRGGYIILPQVGRVPVAGKSISQAEAAVKKALQSSQLQRATVMIERVAGSDVESGPKVFLSGEFRHPRAARIPAGTAPTLVGVILSSGGLTDRADLTRVRVMRMAGGKSVVEEVNVKKILEGSSLSSDLTLSEGDVIVVPATQPNLVYVTGNVKRQGSYHFEPGDKLTAYGAILQSGGFSRFADERKVHVLRAMPDGTKAKIPVDVKAIKGGKKPDVVLQVNDIVIVPEKWWSF